MGKYCKLSKDEILIGILAEMSTLPSLQVAIFILHFEQLK